MAAINFGNGPNTNTGDTLRVAIQKLQDRLDALAAPAPAPTITLSPLTAISLTAGVAFSRTFAASGGTAPYAYAVASGALPAGLTLSGGVLSGTPTTQGAFSFDIKGTDAGGYTSATAAFSGAVAAPAVVGAPVLAWTSDNTVRDPVFTITPAPAFGETYELQVDDDPAFGSLYGSDTNSVDALEAGDGQLAFPAIPTLAYSVTYYARARKNGGAWSGAVSKAMAAAPAEPPPVTAFSTTSGVDKHQSVTVSGTPALTVTGQQDNGLQAWARTLQATTGKRYMEATIASLGSTPGSTVNHLGFDDGALNLNSAFGLLPGWTSPGITLFIINATTWEIDWRSQGATSGSFVTGNRTFAAGDKIGVEADIDAVTGTGTVRFYHIAAGASTGALLHTQVVTLNAWKAVAGSTRSGSLTFNFGASAYARTPTLGYVGWSI